MALRDDGGQRVAPCVYTSKYAYGNTRCSLQCDHVCWGGSMDFDELYKDNYKQIRSTISRYLKSEEDIEDVTQTTFFKAYLGMDSFRGDSNVTTWLTRIAINEAISRIRINKREVDTLVSITPDDGSEDDPESILSTKEGVQEVQRYLATLPEKRFACIVGRELEGKSFKVLSEEVSTPVSTVKTWVKRDRDRIKDIINPASD